MDRSQLLDIDWRKDEPLFVNCSNCGSADHRNYECPCACHGKARNVVKEHQNLDDARTGAIPKTIAEVTSAKALLAPAGLDWQAESHPIYAVIGDTSFAGIPVKVPARKAIIRSDTREVIGDVGENYGVVQNEQLAELADAVRGVDGSWTWAQGGPLRGGSRVFLQLRAPVRSVGGELLQANISLFNSFDGSLKFTAGFSDVVIVCANTFAAALRDASNGLALRHTSGIQQRIEAATKLIEAARKHTDAIDNGILKLLNTDITSDQVRALAQKLVKGDSTKAENVRDALLRAYFNAPGKSPGLAWGAFQAVTYYATHEQHVRETSGRNETEARIESNWWGTGAELTQNAWDVLTDESAIQRLQYVKVVRS